MLYEIYNIVKNKDKYLLKKLDRLCLTNIFVSNRPEKFYI